ncbi:hypothetical protein [uncultured Ferrimonas sp.]|uniref:hypothetical protein n=1 Tax=uncultured Ferrimonas sp. TaxID=432640 RepID=UPI00260232AC|nr:hypothetical protein [uncultured Ferrimonas sp.]
MRLTTTLNIVLTTLVALVMAISAKVSAKELADMWVITPEKGQQQAFELALKKHVEYRKSKNDPRKWQIFTPAVGDHLNHYVIRACCFEWKEMDSYRDWSIEAKTGDHWQANVGDSVAHVSHYLAEVDFENSHWPEEDPGFRYFEVVSLKPKQGHGQGIRADMKAISDAAKAMEWPEYWSWSWGIGGQSELNLVFPFTDWADMEPEKPGFAERLGKQMKSEDKAMELLERWSKHFQSSESTIYVKSDELSMD